MPVLRLAVAAALVAVVAACDRSPTAPPPAAPLVRANGTPRAIEGDTVGCRSGWIIVSGRYECIIDPP